jgi:hypothetical protein
MRLLNLSREIDRRRRALVQKFDGLLYRMF